MRKLELRLTVDDANLLLEGLGQLPFAKVHALVSEIQAQASEQLAGAKSASKDSDEEAHP